MTETISTTCPYCGVGCGLQAKTAGGDVVLRADRMHPANRGRLCSKGSALDESLSLDGRLLHPVVDGVEVPWEKALQRVATGIQQAVAQHGPDSVAFYVSGQLLTEDYYAANKLMKGYIGCANIDTNSRLCMASSVAGYKRAFGTDTVPCCYEDLELAGTIVLVGSNTAWCHPVLFQRISAARRAASDFRLIVIDPRHTASCEIADLHLALRPGTDVVLFNGLLCWLYDEGHANELFLQHFTTDAEQALHSARSAGGVAEVAAVCGLAEEDVLSFYRAFAARERVVTAWSQGVNQSSSGTDKVNAIINCHLLTGRIGRPGMGPFSLTGQPNAMGGREVGGLANQLAAHMELDNAGHRAIVQQFWGSPAIADKPGLKAVDLFQAVEQGKVKVLWIMATNPVDSLPEADRVREAIRRCDLVVVSDCVRDTDTTQLAHVLLPALAWGEKDGTVTNSERCISRQRSFLPAPGEARADWWIISEVAKAMGCSGFDWQGPADIFREHAALSAWRNDGSRDFNLAPLTRLSDGDYDRLQPVQWPLRGDAGSPQGTARMFSDGVFFTPDRRARLIPVTARAPAMAPDRDFPLVLNTGRVRDQWHTMTRTGNIPRLAEHSPEPYLEIHPEDAGRCGVQDGALARVVSRHGEVVLRVNIAPTQQPGSIFVPMHWNDQVASHARVDSLVNAATDPVSGQPELKHTPVRVQPFAARWFGFILARRRLQISGVDYWVRAAGPGCYRYEVAGSQSPAEWAQWARGLLCNDDQNVEWLEYLDKGAGHYRGVRLAGSRLESCLFIGPDHELPSRHWLSGLFAEASINETVRRSLLSGAPQQGGEDPGRVVCACFGVGINTLRRAIREQGLGSVEELGAVLRAGTNCGSCVPELQEILLSEKL